MSFQVRVIRRTADFRQHFTVVATLLDGDTIQYYNGNGDGNGDGNSSGTCVTETCTRVRKRRMGSSVRILLGVGTE